MNKDSKPWLQTGVTLIEVMIGITIGLLIVATLTVVFVNSSRTHSEIERVSQQIENGRYASQVLADDLALAGYYGELNPASVSTPSTKPNACATASADLIVSLALPIQGYEDGETPPACLPVADLVANSDILVVRRSSTCVAGTTGCDAVDTTKGTYFQTGLCATDAGKFVIDTDATKFTLTKPVITSPQVATCGTTAAATADIRAYNTHIYFVTQNNKAGDGVPTLKMISLGGTADGFSDAVAVAAGIERIQLEYGVAADATSAPVYTTAPVDTATWRKVTSVKLHVLARNVTVTPGYTDGKTYILGKKADGTENSFSPGGGYKRHVYTSVARLNNVAGRLQ